MNKLSRWPSHSKLSLYVLAALALQAGDVQAQDPNQNYYTFVDQVALRESSGVVDVKNKYGYMGLFQMGKLALIDAGFKDKSGQWTSLANQYGVKSEQDFLSSKSAQAAAIERYWEKQATYAYKNHLGNYIGKTVDGVKVTDSGVLAGCHLVGCGSVKTFLNSNGATIPTDANSTPVTEYMKKFGGYQTPFNSIIEGNATSATKTLDKDWNSKIDFKYKNPPPQPSGVPQPGGISLSRAAAERLALDLDLEGFSVEHGRLVLAGRAGAGLKVDAALFMTAMRLACERVDPYFSLDPDDGRLWVEEADRASNEMWKRVETDLRLTGADWWRNIPDGVQFRSFSVKRDYPQVWSTVSAKYPNFKTRLVFKPEWLRETRYGEIFYIADVLLKELSSGIPIVVARDAQLRALKVDRYTSARVRAAAEGLLVLVDGGKTSGHGSRGTRFWFDLVPRAKSRMRSMLDEDPIVAKSYQPASPLGQRLNAQLTSLGVRNTAKGAELLRHVSTAGGAVDLSNVYPTMFIIGHDNTTNKDVNGDDPYDLAVAEEVNTRMKEFIAAYAELRELTEAFRLYVAAVALVKRDDRSCGPIRQQPLLAGEKARIRMPEHHSSELTFTVASFGHNGPDGRKTAWWSNANYYYGGVSPGQLYEQAVQRPTSLTNTIQQETAGMRDRDSWVGKSGKKYYALVIEGTKDAPQPSKAGAAKPARGLLDDP